MTDQSRLQLTDALIEKMLAQRAGPGAPADLIPAIAAAIESTGQRSRGWLVWPPGTPTRGRALRVAAFAVALVVVVTGAGLLLQRLPAQVAAPTAPPSLVPVATQAPEPTASTSPVATARPVALIAFIWRIGRGNSMGGTARVFLVRSDGTGVHELIPGGTGNQSGVSWSPDGSRLIYAENGRIYITDVAGTPPQLLDTGCGADFSDADPAFSPDGTRIVFRHGCTGRIATMDLASDQVVDLESTASLYGDRPRWSPDGREIAFSTSYKAAGGTDVYIVDTFAPDGQNLRKLTSAKLSGRYPSWSPDGSRIVFTAYRSRILGSGANRYEVVQQNVYTVGPSGADLQVLTTDDISVGATWTSDGRILFGRLTQDAAQGDGGLWTMNADGSGVERVFDGPTELTSEPYIGHPAEWQPTP
jgi:dipeptidyl aminopeptidase/acylaminoacyl peptidase